MTQRAASSAARENGAIACFVRERQRLGGGVEPERVGAGIDPARVDAMFTGLA